ATVFSKSYFGHKSSSTYTLSNVYCCVITTSLLDSYNSLSSFMFCGAESMGGIA
uniref:Uncharacterized protein n=1 Tax=Amphimedon queenslandica TaxID=400682 RepID=A0A1X7VCG2_AMPQE